MHPVVPQTLYPVGTSEGFFLAWLRSGSTWHLSLACGSDPRIKNMWQRLKMYTETHTSGCVKCDRTLIFGVPKYLGLSASSQLLWHLQVTNLVNKAARYLLKSGAHAVGKCNYIKSSICREYTPIFQLIHWINKLILYQINKFACKSIYGHLTTDAVMQVLLFCFWKQKGQTCYWNKGHMERDLLQVL